jgi:hypothetical protein
MYFHFRYAVNGLQLWLTQKISFATFLHGMRNKPVALAGPKGAYIVAPDFE